MACLPDHIASIRIITIDARSITCSITTALPQKRATSCYGCIHLQYRGPIGVLPDDEISADEQGTYHCRLFSESRGPAHGVPRPLLSRCKETL